MVHNLDFMEAKICALLLRSDPRHTAVHTSDVGLHVRPNGRLYGKLGLELGNSKVHGQERVQLWLS